MAKPKYRVGQAFLYLDKKKVFEIHAIEDTTKMVAPRIPRPGDVLYSVVYLPKTEKPSFGRYYQSKLTESCIPIDNTEMAQILYGIKI